ncbi:iron-sulfur cluster assembly accessory protein [Rudanella paleaurantiibacter]|uniref:Iron-sulfur cluster assembly accessory protein n=1 Tax=Rudanella paleaurantiibacter TaxID=2614655 RepID=A0A7J5TZ33_9BACT|nr:MULTISPECIES: adhesin [Rudanella]KAB7730311.1 iron-sulfur cluster assembly accessory protein [Rudanella paleaurantiibacter]
MLDQPVRITAEAHYQIQNTLNHQKIPAEYGLRVGVRGGGCGASWLLGFDTPGPTDEVYNVEGVRVIIDRKHLLYVLGAQIGFEAGEEGRGFTVEKA